MKGLCKRKNRTAVHSKVRISKRAEWMGFFRVIMRIEATIATRADPIKTSHWKIMLMFCSDMEDLCH
jgi:hypothetical protein